MPTSYMKIDVNDFYNFFKIYFSFAYSFDNFVFQDNGSEFNIEINTALISDDLT